MSRLLRSATGATTRVYTALVRVVLFVTVLLSGQVATTAFAQTNAYLKARCTQLISYYDYYGASRGEASDGAKNHARIKALIDCERGNYAAGIKAMEGLLTRKNIGVPRPDVAGAPDGRVPRIDTALIPPDQTEQRHQSSAQSNDAAYCATLSKIYRKTAPQHKTSSVTVPVAMANCDSGDTAAGIPVLEQALKNEGMTLPQR
jgi:hypothetical protein